MLRPIELSHRDPEREQSKGCGCEEKPKQRISALQYVELVAVKPAICLRLCTLVTYSVKADRAAISCNS